MRVVHVHVHVCQLLPSAAQNQIFPAVKQPATFLDQLHCAHAFEVGEIISPCQRDIQTVAFLCSQPTSKLLAGYSFLAVVLRVASALESGEWADFLSLTQTLPVLKTPSLSS